MRTVFNITPCTEKAQLVAGDADIFTLWPFKSALLQLFDVQRKAVPVPLKQPDLIGPLTNKYKYIPTQRVLSKFIAHQPGKRVNTKPHVAWGAVEKITTGMG